MKNTQPAILGNVPPQAIELEEAILGGLMLEKSTLTKHIGSINPEYFYSDSHQKIAQSILDLYASGKPIDLLTVTNHLRSKSILAEVGGASYMTDLTDRISGGAHLGEYILIIKEKYLMRKMIHLGMELMGKGYDSTANCFEVMDYGQMQLINMVGNMVSKSVIDIKQSMGDVFEEIAKNITKNQNNEITGVSTGLRRLDDLTGGWQNGDLVVLAARPAMGKTGLALSLSRAAAKQGKKVLLCSLEMTHKKLSYRMIAQETKMIDITKMQRGAMDLSDLNALMLRTNHMVKYGIKIDDDASMTVMQLRAKANQMKMEGGLDMIVLDYLQLMQDHGSKSGNREQEISSISRGLKVLAKDLDIPVIALSQLSRAVETRGGDHRPKLSDLRESGAIEQDADMVIFLYRPEYYGISEYNIDDDQLEATNGLAIGDIAKHRNGAIGEFYMRFHHKFTDFTDWNPAPPKSSSNFNYDRTANF